MPAGDVFLSETMVISAQDSGKTFRGADNGSTRLVGGIRVSGWTKRADGVWCAKSQVVDGTPAFAESLFVNGRRIPRARFPKSGFVRATSVTQEVCEASSTGYRTILALPEMVSDLLENVPADELRYAQLLAHIKWDVARYPLSGYGDGMLTVDGRKTTGWNVWSTNDFYVLENVRSAFTDPGEWFSDVRAGELLYRSLEGESVKEAMIPCDGFETLVRIDNATNVVFENVAFACSAPVRTKGPTCLAPNQAAVDVTTAAVVVDRSQGIEFRNCRFEHLGSYALWFREGVRESAVRNCRMTDLGAGGIRIGGIGKVTEEGMVERLDSCTNDVASVETADWMTSGIVVDNCLIAGGGRFHPAGVGVFLTTASDCRITHNEIHDLYYTGVSLGWVWGYSGSPSQRNLVANNLIYDIGQRQLADMGGIYTLGTSFGTVIRGNVIHDVHSYTYGGWGLYNDEGSEGILLEDNLVFATDDASYHQHYGKDNVLRNNVLIDSGEGQVAVTKAERHRSLTVERNVVIWTSGDAFGRYEGTRRETARIDWRSNVWWRVDGKESFNGTAFGEWAARVGDRGSVFADPGIRGWSAKEYSARPSDACAQIGFVSFDPMQAGRRNTP